MNIKKTIREEINKFKRNKKRINESEFSGKTIMNVDIQDDYRSAIHFDLNEWVEFINKTNEENLIVFLYNGEEIGGPSENEYIMWLLDLGISEGVITDSYFYDKGYAFFRYCMDSGIDEELIAELIKFMIKKGVNDSRDLNEDLWDEFIDESEHDINDIREILEYADDMVYIPELIDFLKYYNNIVLLGGGLDECLKEVEIALMAINKNYEIFNKYVY